MLMKPGILRASRLSGLLLCIVLLWGCAGLSSAPDSAAPSREALDAFSLEGRFSLRHEEKNYSGRLSWRHAGMNNELLLSSPFGQGMAEIKTSESGARLTTSDGKLYSASDTETLTKQVHGYPLPLVPLTDWIRGRATAGGISELDEQGRLLRLRQEGWTIDSSYEGNDPKEPPARIIAERAGGFELRLRIDEWNSLSSGENKP
jgi:outer membrane lipoprotein LolB